MKLHSLPPSPYPGLRPFEEDQQMIFFGRDTQSTDVLDRLGDQRFVGLIGESGCGKSSLVRAGVLPLLRGGLMDGSSASWMVSIMRPGLNPIKALAEQLTRTLSVATDPDHAIDAASMETTLRFGVDGLVEASEDVLSGGPDAGRLLIVVDQFEELFKYRATSETARNEVALFVRLLLTAVRQTRVQIYVMLTMRIDFLSNCADIAGLSEALNKGQYLVPPMSREERRTAIVRPAELYGKTVEPRLVERLLNDAGDASDRLPVMQHVLMRCWEIADGRDTLTLDDYVAVGGIKNALSQHANSILAGLSKLNLGRTVEVVFKALASRGPSGQLVSQPCEKSLLYDLAGSSEANIEHVDAVVAAFSGLGRDLLIDRTGADVEFVEVSHEALLRNWTKLTRDGGREGWIEEEVEARQRWRELVKRADSGKEKEIDILRGKLLHKTQDWVDKKQPTAAWVTLINSDISRSSGGSADENTDRSSAAELAIVDTFMEVCHRAARSNKRGIYFLRAALAAAIVSIGVVIFTVTQGRLDEAQDAITDARELLEEGSFQLALDEALLAQRALPELSIELQARALLGLAGEAKVAGELTQTQDYLARVAEIAEDVRIGEGQRVELHDRSGMIRDAVHLSSAATRSPEPDGPVLRTDQPMLFAGDGQAIIRIEPAPGIIEIESNRFDVSADSTLRVYAGDIAASPPLAGDDDGGWGLAESGAERDSFLIFLAAAEKDHILWVRNISTAATFPTFEVTMRTANPFTQDANYELFWIMAELMLDDPAAFASYLTTARVYRDTQDARELNSGSAQFVAMLGDALFESLRDRKQVDAEMLRRMTDVNLAAFGADSTRDNSIDTLVKRAVSQTSIALALQSVAGGSPNQTNGFFALAIELDPSTEGGIAEMRDARPLTRQDDPDVVEDLSLVYGDETTFLLGEGARGMFPLADPKGITLVIAELADGGADSVLTLLDEQKIALAYNDDRSGGLDSILAFDAASTAEVLLELSNIGGVGLVKLRIFDAADAEGLIAIYGAREEWSADIADTLNSVLNASNPPAARHFAAAETMVTIDPDQGRNWSTRAQLHIWAENWDDAQSDLTRAILLGDGTTQTLANLSIAQFRLGDPSAARQTLQQAEAVALQEQMNFDLSEFGQASIDEARLIVREP